MEHPAELPEGGAAAAEGAAPLARRVCDHLAGMTDRFAAQQFRQHFLPRRWRGAD
jgi:dGTP triphosphohydrolase